MFQRRSSSIHTPSSQVTLPPPPEFPPPPPRGARHEYETPNESIRMKTIAVVPPIRRGQEMNATLPEDRRGAQRVQVDVHAPGGIFEPPSENVYDEIIQS